MLKILTALSLLIIVAFMGWYFFIKNFDTSKSTQTEKKTVRIGLLSQKTNKTYETSLDSMRAELTKFGYNPQYIQDEIKDSADYLRVARRYVDEKVDVIVTNSTPATQAALKATTTIPIVFGSVGDPVLNGVVQSLDSSGNNATGVSSLSVDLTPKRLGLLKEAKPSIKKVYFIHQPGETSSDNSRTKVVKEASELNITLVEKPATDAAEVVKIASNIKAAEGEAMLMAASAMIWSKTGELIEAQNRERILAIGSDRSMVERGLLFSYGPNYKIMGQQLAQLVDQVLKGAKPQYLAIQRPRKIELLVNKKVADNLGIIIPESILSKADDILR